ncbi:MAG TPA: dipicolinate synthase subunit DpsA [Clostridiaceae bacterium]|nr:dipicolinate synthase subunit DpsA [Clostridiaceae bacterium]
MTKKSFSIIGGDLRSIKLANLLIEDDNKVKIFGFENAGFDLGIAESDSLFDAINQTDIVIGPIPFSNDNENLNAPFSKNPIPIYDVFSNIKDNQLLIAGVISKKIAQISKEYNVCSIDLLNREEMAILNAIPTAEGAIKIAIEETPTTLHNSNVLVLGFGRIGKTLARMLKGIGANVYVEARKYSDLAWIQSSGYIPVPLDDLANYLPRMNIIFNTIPHVILNYDLLYRIDRDCLIIDLASKPGGVDFEKARELGLNTIWALSLPGKIAPVTAAKFIKDTIYNIIEELGG